MPGGLLNLVAYGSENIILNENPSKTFFKSVYKKYTNFGLQTFRIDHTGTNHIQENVKSTFKFKVKRYGDLLHDTYLSITLPDIYGSGPLVDGIIDHDKKYNFKWIKHLGYNMIDEVSITIGGQLINKYSGEYLLMLQHQFQSDDKMTHLNEMTGNTDDLNDPAKYIKNYYNYNPSDKGELTKTDYYPASGTKNEGTDTIKEPSIKGKKLYIPINAWFGNSMKQALPLVALQYHEVDIVVTLKAVKDLYVVQNRHLIKFKDNDSNLIDPVFCRENGTELPVELPQPSVKEQFDYGIGKINKTYTQLLNKEFNDRVMYKYIYNYLAPEENKDAITFDMFIDGTFRNWDPDIHLVSTFVFLTEEERTIFAKDHHVYLIKICYEQEFLGLVGNHSVSVHVNGLIGDMFWRYRRSDAGMRNEWTNYSNIKYSERYNYFPILSHDNNVYETQSIQVNEETNEINILKKLEIMFDGKIREESFPENIFRCLQKYRTKNTFTRELKQLYYYSFGLEEGLEDLQPSGAVNTSKYKNISFLFETINTPDNPNVEMSTLVKYIQNTVPPNGNSAIPFNVVVDNASSNEVLAENTTGTYIPVFDKRVRQEKLYTFDLKICTRKYNMLIINSGMGGLKYSR